MIVLLTMDNYMYCDSKFGCNSLFCLISFFTEIIQSFCLYRVHNVHSPYCLDKWFVQKTSSWHFKILCHLLVAKFLFSCFSLSILYLSSNSRLLKSWKQFSENKHILLCFYVLSIWMVWYLPGMLYLTFIYIRWRIIL